jgi:hypothetical protein
LNYFIFILGILLAFLRHLYHVKKCIWIYDDDDDDDHDDNKKLISFLNIHFHMISAIPETSQYVVF